MGQKCNPATPAYAWYVVFILSLFYILSFVDRQILAILVEPMQADLGFSDIQLSYLGGLSFVVFYTLCGIPIGRLADTQNRRRLIATGVVLWSASTVLCGTASRFWHFLVLRMGVGVGEAALSPSAYSMITDLFPRERLATAISVYSMGAAIGMGLSYLGGALLLRLAIAITSDPGFTSIPMVGSLRPWQIVFMAVGIPGILLSSLLLTIKEPERRGSRPQTRRAGEPLPDQENTFTAVFAHIRGSWQPFTYHFLGMGCIGLATFSAGFWDIAFLSRTHGWSPQESGLWYGLMAMAGQAFGNFAGGRLSDYYSSRGIRGAKMMILLFSAAAWIPFGIAYPLMPSVALTMGCLLPVHILAGMPWGCAAAAVQVMSPTRMRGQISAIYLFAVNIIGLGLGPLLVALLTERVFNHPEHLRYSLLVVGTSGHVGATILFFLALKPYRELTARREKAENE
jgi:MFS family permease